MPLWLIYGNPIVLTVASIGYFSLFFLPVVPGGLSGVLVANLLLKRILKDAGYDPGPKRSEATWDEFLKQHAASLYLAAIGRINRALCSWRGLISPHGPSGSSASQPPRQLELTLHPVKAPQALAPAESGPALFCLAP